MDEQKQTQTDTITITKTSVGVVNVAVITLLMGASLIIAAGIVMGLSNMKTMPTKRTPAIYPTSNAFMPKVIDDGHLSMPIIHPNQVSGWDVYNRGVFAGSLVDVSWYPSGNIGVNSLNPLSIEVNLGSNTTKVDVLSQAITLQTDGNVVTTLCYPGRKGISSGNLKYYYDIYGTPYHNSELTVPVMNSDCPRILANSYNPMNLVSGEINSPYPDEVGPFVRSNIIRESQPMGAYLGSDNGFEMELWDEYENYELIGGKSPLLVSIGHFAEGEITIPERVWTIGSYDPNSSKVLFYGVHDLCIPSVTLEPNVGAFFFYDLNGRPYADALLTRAIACGVNPGDNDYEIHAVTKSTDNMGNVVETLPDMIVE
ncbi:MAG: hypothetical protein WCW66_06550 [Patescibacteria group bacterium]